jgi:TPP-dependent pyruvate/acetoin dehydrogenase alpha subunit
MNMAAVMRLPLIVIIENNQFAYSTPVRKQFAAAKLSDRALGYGIPGVTIDGTDVLKVHDACRAAFDRARKGEGPTLIETVTMRMQGHSASDDASYVPKEMFEAWKDKDPLLLFERLLTAQNVLDDSGKRKVEESIRQAIEEAVHAAESAPYPEGPDAAGGVYAA